MSPFAVLAAVVALAAGPAQVVHRDGRIGPFRIDVTTKAQLVAALGKPRTTEVAVPKVGGKRTGIRLAYSCGARCDTVYSFSDKTGMLSDFATSSPVFRTEGGSHPGMSAASAMKVEGRPVGPGCGSAKLIHVRWDATHELAVLTLSGRVTIIAYIGPHSTYHKPFC
ncbi:MAG TPA: hypothetical protein VNY33_02470 [Gaiellaceae bacterium]|nr:hypothetical protein [Gaiellaceae bacterium]